MGVRKTYLQPQEAKPGKVVYRDGQTHKFGLVRSERRPRRENEPGFSSDPVVEVEWSDRTRTVESVHRLRDAGALLDQANRTYERHQTSYWAALELDGEDLEDDDTEDTA